MPQEENGYQGANMGAVCTACSFMNLLSWGSIKGFVVRIFASIRSVFIFPTLYFQIHYISSRIVIEAWNQLIYLSM